MEIAILDDSEINCYVLKETICNHSKPNKMSIYQVPEDFIDDYTSNKINPDLVFLDIMMPKIDGFEVANRLRKNHKKSPLIIGITALPKSDLLVKKYHSYGLEVLLFKPYSMNDIYKYLEKK